MCNIRAQGPTDYILRRRRTNIFFHSSLRDRILEGQRKKDDLHEASRLGMMLHTVNICEKYHTVRACMHWATTPRNILEYLYCVPTRAETWIIHPGVETFRKGHLICPGNKLTVHKHKERSRDYQALQLLTNRHVRTTVGPN